MAASQSSRIVELASIIANRTNECDQWFASKGIPSPSFDQDLSFSVTVPEHIAQAREQVIEASAELQALMLGPAGFLQQQMREVIMTR